MLFRYIVAVYDTNRKTMHSSSKDVSLKTYYITSLTFIKNNFDHIVYIIPTVKAYKKKTYYIT